MYVAYCKQHNFFFKTTVLFTSIDSSVILYVEILRNNYQKINSLVDKINFSQIKFKITTFKSFKISSFFMIMSYTEKS